MNKLSTTIAVGMLTATFAGAAHAEPVADGFAIGLERAFGLVIASDTAETDAGSSTDSATSVSFGFSPNLGYYSVPRLGMDYILSSGLSFGAGLGLAHVSTSNETEPDGGPSVDTDQGSSTALLLAPRVGFVIGITDALGIWPRGGITHVSRSSESGDDSAFDFEVSQSRTAFTLEAPLVVMAGPVGFLIAPTLDIGIGGSAEVDGVDGVDGGESDADYSATEFGLQFGIMGVI